MAKKAKLRINVNIGSRIKAHGSPTEANKDIVDGLLEESIKSVRPRLMLRLRGLEKRMQTVVERSYMTALNNVTTKMMGLFSPPRTPSTVKIPGVPHSVVWAPLSQQTRAQKAINPSGLGRGNLTGRSKSKLASAGDFFVDTGKLRKELTQNARRIVRNTGLVKVYVKPDGKGQARRTTDRREDVPLANVSIRIMPRIPSSLLSDLGGGASQGTAFEQMLGISADSIKKLQGTKNHRALLQPVFSYWTVYHIPREIGGVMQDALYQAQRNLDKVSMGTGSEAATKKSLGVRG